MDDFRCDVLGGEGEDIRGRGPDPEEPGNTEISELHPPVVAEQDVARLDIAVEDPDLVGRDKGVGDGHPDRCHQVSGERALRRDDVGK